MSKSRIKIPLPLISSRTEAEAVMNDLSLAANNRRKLAARMDAAILKIQDEAAPGIALCDDSIKAKSDALRAWAEANPAEFGKKKSIEFLAGTLGFRTGTPKLALLSRAWNWDKVLDVLKGSAMYQKFVRTKQEVDKERVLAEAGAGCFDPGYCGTKVVQDESFYVEPKLTEEVQS